MIAPDQRCETCVWWHATMPVIAAATRDAEQRPDLGTCQVEPPHVVQTSWGIGVAVWPQTHASRGCGAWEPAEHDDDSGDDGPGGGEIVSIFPDAERMAA